MGTRQEYLCNRIAEFCKKLDEKGFVANHDGNISTKYEGTLLATPTAESKGAITKEMIITLDMSGNKIAGIGKPFSEIKLHLAAYQARPEIRAVVHAHPPFATARGLCGAGLEVNLPEAVVSIGSHIPVTSFAMPGAKENDSIIANALAVSDVFMMPGNGVLAVGDDLEQAYLRLELLEHLAKIDYYAQSMGSVMKLSEQDKNELLAKRASIGLGPKQVNATPKTVVTPPRQDSDEHRELIAAEIRKMLS